MRKIFVAIGLILTVTGTSFAQTTVVAPFVFNPVIETVSGFSNPWGLVAGANVTLTVGAISLATGESPREVIRAFQNLRGEMSSSAYYVAHTYWATGIVTYYETIGDFETARILAEESYRYIIGNYGECFPLLDLWIALATARGRTWEDAAQDLWDLAALQFNVIEQTHMPDPRRNPCDALRWLRGVVGQMRQRALNPNGRQAAILSWADGIIDYAEIACRTRGGGG